MSEPTHFDELRARALADFQAGYASADEIAEGLRDDADDLAGEQEEEPATEHDIERIVREAKDAALLAQVSFPETTDCDRLDRAFAALESIGIVCRENFTCCGTCGHAEIGDEVQAERDQGRQPKGYAFFHQQDTEHAVDGSGIYLAYGSLMDGDLSTVQVGQRVVEVFSTYGLPPKWNGSSNTRILVPMVWQRRLRA